MKKFVKWLLNHLPRPVLQRLSRLGVPLLGLLYVGRGVECPVCGVKRRGFLPYGYVTLRENALCPRCMSLERHRMLWLWLCRHSDLMSAPYTVLHIAPELSLMKPLRRAIESNGGRYVTADLESPLADLHFDVEQMPLDDESQDVVICNHLLEHVADDGRALRQIWRVMRHGGWGVILSPVDYSLESTFEDDSITDPAERTRIFGQYDHRRLYGRDFGKRLAAAGFSVEEIDYSAELDPRLMAKYALTHDHIYIIRKK